MRQRTLAIIAVAVGILVILGVGYYMLDQNRDKQENCIKFCKYSAIELDTQFVGFTEDGLCECEDGTVGK